MKVTAFALLSAMVGGVVVALITPKEQGNELAFWIAGLLAGSVAALFSFACIHLIKSSKYKLINEQDGAEQLTTDTDENYRAVGFYKHLGWKDWKIENGVRFMKKRSNQIGASNH